MDNNKIMRMVMEKIWEMFFIDNNTLAFIDFMADKIFKSMIFQNKEKSKKKSKKKRIFNLIVKFLSYALNFGFYRFI